MFDALSWSSQTQTPNTKADDRRGGQVDLGDRRRSCKFSDSFFVSPSLVEQMLRRCRLARDVVRLQVRKAQPTLTSFFQTPKTKPAAGAAAAGDVVPPPGPRGKGGRGGDRGGQKPAAQEVREFAVHLCFCLRAKANNFLFFFFTDKVSSNHLWKGDERLVHHHNTATAV